MSNSKIKEENSYDSYYLFNEYIRTKDSNIRETLILNHRKLVFSIVKRFKDRGAPFDSLMSVGTIGLIKAVDNFDLTRHIEFSTYATTVIVGEIKHYFRSEGFILQAPRRYQELYPKFFKAVELLSKKLGRNPKVSEIANQLNEAEETILELMELKNLHHPISLDSKICLHEKNEFSVKDTLGIDDKDLGLTVDRIDLENALKKLDKKKRIVINLFFFHDISQEEIATRLNISQMEASRILKKSISTLKKYLT
jgi:RNA polymerase sigma-B factor